MKLRISKVLYFFLTHQLRWRQMNIKMEVNAGEYFMIILVLSYT